MLRTRAAWLTTSALVSIAACAGAAVVPTGAAAQAAQPAAERDQTQIEEVVVTARRVEESLQSVPIAVTALSAEQVRQEGIKNVKDLLGQAPAMFLATGTGGTTTVNLQIRGQSGSGSLLINSVPVGVYFNGINYPRAVGLRSAMYDISEVEILKGPQGTLFGKNTTGGALLINSKAASTSDFGGYAQLTAGGYHLGQFTGAVNVPVIADKLGVRLAVVKTRRDGYGEQGDGRDSGNQNEEAARLSVRYTPTDSIRLDVTADTLRVRGGGNVIRTTAYIPGGSAAGPMLTGVATELGLAAPSSAASQATALNTLLGIWRSGDAYHNASTNSMYGNFDQGGFSADLSVDFSGLTFRSITGQRQNNRDDQQDYDSTQFKILHPDSLQESKNFTQEFQLLNDPKARLSWIIGAFFNDEKGVEGSKTFQLNAAAANVTDYDVHNKSYAAFAQANYSVTDKLRVTGGIRYTKETEHVFLRNRSELPLGTFLRCSLSAALNTQPPCGGVGSTKASDPTWLLSVDYKPLEDVLVYGKVSTSFQAGGVNIASTAVTPFAPEKATVYEAGLKGDFLDRRVRFNAAAYYTDYKDIQRTSIIVINNTLTQLVANAAKATIKGAEFELTARPIEPLTLKASGSVVDVTYDRFVDATGDRSKEPFPTPKYQYAFSGTYVAPTPAGDLRLHAAYHWQDDVVFSGNAKNLKSVTQTAYGLWDARASLELPGDSDLSVYVKNITNKTYLTNTITLDGSFGFNIGFIGDPRTWGVEYRKRFGGG